MSSNFERFISVKAPQDAILDVPQEAITGDILRGYGPRRGNLERLLRYWRPIMRKPGGFRRCRVILANHPELYPLERLCAWLHHETTGLWPNEGCHHPGMKNCKGKLKKRNWSDSEFGKRLKRTITPPKLSGKKSAFVDYEDDFFFSEFDYAQKQDQYQQVVTETDITHAMKVLSEFAEMEKSFIDYLRNEDNWEIVGEDAKGNKKSLPFDGSLSKDCCGGEIIDG
jgi:hypothetical protein